jgi:hypothetical protein
MQITTIGLDLAKHVFQVHGIDAAEKVVVRKQFRRGQVLKFFEALSPCLIGMEACASAHYVSSCTAGAVHTWHKADIPRLTAICPLSGANWTLSRHRRMPGYDPQPRPPWEAPRLAVGAVIISVPNAEPEQEPGAPDARRRKQ